MFGCSKLGKKYYKKRHDTLVRVDLFIGSCARHTAFYLATSGTNTALMGSQRMTR